MRVSSGVGLVGSVLLLAAMVTAADSPADDGFKQRLKKVRAAILTGTTTRAEKAAAFERASSAAKDDSRMQVALLEEAFANALSGMPKDPCREIAERMLKQLTALGPKQKDLWAQKQIELLRRAYQTTRDKKAKATAGTQLLEALLAHAHELEANRRWARASTTLSEAARLARILARKDTQEILVRYGRARHFARVRQQADRLKKALTDKPDNHSVREELISLLVVDLDEPAEAKEHLSDDVDESWRIYVPMAAGQAADLQADAARNLGDWYARALIKRAISPYSKAIVLSRAVAWYEQSARLGKGQDALLAKIAADKLRKKLTQLPPPPPRPEDKPKAPTAPDKIAISVMEPWPFSRPVRKGQKLHITATGRWRVMPRGKWHGPDGGKFYLQGRLDDGQPFRVGADITIEIKRDGVLHLGMFEGGKYSNNRGGITVTIEKVK